MTVFNAEISKKSQPIEISTIKYLNAGRVLRHVENHPETDQLYNYF